MTDYGYIQHLNDGEEGLNGSEKDKLTLHCNKHSEFVHVEDDLLNIKYIGPANHGADVGAIVANEKISLDESCFYFEAKIKHMGTKGDVCIGFGDYKMDLKRKPGADKHSYGFSVLEGEISHGKFETQSSGTGAIEIGSILGAGINLDLQEIFFTLDGKRIEPFFSIATAQEYCFPVVSVHSPGESVQVNFGQQDFAFDLNKYKHEHHQNDNQTIMKQQMDYSKVKTIVRDYLIASGYTDTLAAFEKENGTRMEQTKEEDNDLAQSFCNKTLDLRQKIRSNILKGNIVDAIELVQGHDFNSKAKSSALCILNCQQFVELLRKNEIQDAIAFAQSVSAGYEYREQTQNHLQLLHDASGLICYNEPETSELGWLLSQNHRETIAFMVNQNMLMEKGESDEYNSVLEKLFQQLVDTRKRCYMKLRGNDNEERIANQLVSRIKRIRSSMN